MEDRRNFMALAARYMKRQHGIDVQIMGEANTYADGTTEQTFQCLGAWGMPGELTDEQKASFAGFCSGWLAAHGDA